MILNLSHKELCEFISSTPAAKTKGLKITFKGSALYQHHLPKQVKIKPNDVDVELVMNHLANIKDIEAEICKLFSIKESDIDGMGEGKFKIWRGDGVDENSQIRNVEFTIKQEKSGLPLPLNIIIRDPQYQNPPEKDWLVSCDGLRMVLKKEDQTALSEPVKLDICDDLELKLRDALTELVRDILIDKIDLTLAQKLIDGCVEKFNLGTAQK